VGKILTFLPSPIPPTLKPLFRFLRILTFLRVLLLDGFATSTCKKSQFGVQSPQPSFTSLEFKAPKPASLFLPLHLGLWTSNSAERIGYPPRLEFKAPNPTLLGLRAFFGALDFKQPGAHRCPVCLKSKRPWGLVLRPGPVRTLELQARHRKNPILARKNGFCAASPLAERFCKNASIFPGFSYIFLFYFSKKWEKCLHSCKPSSRLM